MLLLSLIVAAGVSFSGCSDSPFDAHPGSTTQTPDNAVGAVPGGNIPLSDSDSPGFDTPEDYVRAMFVQTTVADNLLQKPGSFDPSFKQTLADLTEQANELARTSIEDETPEGLLSQLTDLENDFDTAISQIQSPWHPNVTEMRSLMQGMLSQFPYLLQYSQDEWEGLIVGVLSSITPMAYGPQNCEDLCQQAYIWDFAQATALYGVMLVACHAFILKPWVYAACLVTASAYYFASVGTIETDRDICLWQCTLDEDDPA